MFQEPTEPQPPMIEPTQAVYNPYTPSYYDGLPSLPPPPPPREKWGRRAFTLTFVLILILILLGCTGLVFYRLGSVTSPSAVAPATPSVSPASPTVNALANSAYTATDILADFTKAGALLANIEYGTTIWAYSGNNYFVSVHATSSALWLDPPQTEGSSSLGLWVYQDVITAQSAYTQVGQDEGQGALPHYEWPSEYLHGRCLLLIMGSANGTTPWNGYAQVLDQYCV